MPDHLNPRSSWQFALPPGGRPRTPKSKRDTLPNAWGLPADDETPPVLVGLKKPGDAVAYVSAL
jgi:hypothetical protein